MDPDCHSGSKSPRISSAMNKIVSQRDLARLAGVSPMTVSLALRGSSLLADATRARIVRLAKEHNYYPDPSLAALSARRAGQASAVFQGTIAWITSCETENAWRDMLQLVGYYKGVCEGAEKFNYKVEAFWIREPGLSAERATQILLARGVRGLVVAPLPESSGRIDLGWNHFSAVTLGYSLCEPKLNVVMNHQFRNMTQLYERLWELGYRRIGFAMSIENNKRVDGNYFGGFLAAQQNHMHKDIVVKSRPELLAKNFNREIFLDWFRRSAPDALIVAPSSSRKIIGWLLEIGLRVPRDVGVAVATVPYRDKFLSGIDEGVETVGAYAVEILIGMILRCEKGVPPCSFSHLKEGGAWVAGKTIRKQRLSPRKGARRKTRTIPSRT